mmetsp:Transcript_115273/g.372518  ORF Transcript_115273/g.372518 Transcript_115273/m.372518 type:complete len:291 (+) Transcript_115273:1007-1879(+)
MQHGQQRRRSHCGAALLASWRWYQMHCPEGLQLLTALRWTLRRGAAQTLLEQEQDKRCLERPTGHQLQNHQHWLQGRRGLAGALPPSSGLCAAEEQPATRRALTTEPRSTPSPLSPAPAGLERAQRRGVRATPPGPANGDRPRAHGGAQRRARGGGLARGEGQGRAGGLARALAGPGPGTGGAGATKMRRKTRTGGARRRPTASRAARSRGAGAARAAATSGRTAAEVAGAARAGAARGGTAAAAVTAATAADGGPAAGAEDTAADASRRRAAAQRTAGIAALLEAWLRR